MLTHSIIGKIELTYLRVERFWNMKKVSLNRLKNKKGLALVIVMITILFSIDVSSSQVNILTDLIEGLASAFDSRSSEYESGEVIRVVDGDTLIVDLNGIDQKVRLIGVDTPESVGKYLKHPEVYGKEASTFTEEMLEGEKVFLEKDVRDTDQYGRLLRYVWLDIPNPENEAEIESEMFNAMLLMKGYANVMTIAPDDKYSELFEALEQSASEQDEGLWGIENEK